jgi:hypothetical protein
MAGDVRVILLKTALVGLLLAFALLGQAPPAASQGGSGYEMAWWTVDGGGSAQSGAGAYALSATAGQPDSQTVAAGGYAISGGFWPRPARYRIYLPLLLWSG